MLYVCSFGVIFTYLIDGIYLKVISTCFIIDYLQIADLHIFAYGRAEFASISLKCAKVKPSIINNFASKYVLRKMQQNCEYVLQKQVFLQKSFALALNNCESLYIQM